MTLEAIMGRLNAEESDLTVVAKHLLSNSKLSDLVKALGSKRYTRETAYALAKAYAEETLGESVGEIAPLMAQDRMRMVSAKRESIQAAKVLSAQQRRLEEFIADEEGLGLQEAV